MTTAPDTVYSVSKMEAIAETLKVPLADVMAHCVAMEAAASQYRAQPDWKTDSAKGDLDQAEAACHKLLAVFGVDRVEAAEDGPGPRADRLVRALEVVQEEDWIRAAIWTVGRLAKAVAAAKPYQIAPKPSDSGARIALAIRGAFTGHSPDLALDSFAADMMRIYTAITGKKPTAPRREGKIYGPCFDFLVATMDPAGAVSPMQPDRIGNLLDTLIRRDR
jgi:hypothetical protein